MKTSSPRSLLKASLLAYQKPEMFSQEVSVFPSKIAFIPPVFFSVINAAWIINIARQMKYTLDNSTPTPILDASRFPIKSFLFIMIVFVLVLLSTLLVIGIEAALLQVTTQFTRTITVKTHHLNYRSYFILVSHAHFCYLLETLTLGIILNLIVFLSGSNPIIKVNTSQNIFSLEFNDYKYELLESGLLLSFFSSIFLFSLIMSMILSSYLLKRMLIGNHSENKRETLQIFIPYNLGKTLLVILAPIPMLF